MHVIRSESINRMLMSYYFAKEYGKTKIIKGDCKSAFQTS